MKIIKFFALVQTLCFALLINSFTPVDGEATTQPILVDGVVSSEALVGKISYFLDETRELDINRISSVDFEKQFQSVDSEFIDFGFTKSFIWLKFTLKNQLVSDDRFMLFFRENFFPNFNVYQRSPSGEISIITEQMENSGFDVRPVAFPFLVAPVDLEPGETTDVYVRYSSGGSSEVRFTIETEESFSEFSGTTFFKNSIFYGMLALLFMVSAAVFVYSRRKLFFAYAASTLVSLLLIMHLDGTAFQFVWPSFPQFNGNASLYVGMLSLFFGAMFAREFLQTKRYHPFVDKVLIGIMIFSAGSIAASWFLDTQLMKYFLIILAPFTYLWFLISGLVAARKRFKEVRFYVIAWAGVFISSVGLMAREILGIDLSEELQWDSMRVVMVSDAAFMGLGLLDRFNQLRIASQKNLKSSLKQAKQNLELTQRLNDLEKKFENVSELAQSKDADLMNTVHDLRQPLHVLRMKVHDLMQGNAADDNDFDSVKQTFGYLEGLVSERLEGTASDVIIRDESEDDGQGNALSTDAVLSGIHEMFENDAKEKGLELNYQASSAELDFDSLALMRLASNLVSNAIKYTEEGQVSFGLTNHGHGASFKVCDTGSGMTQEQFNAALQRNVRLEEGSKQAQGNGYGLAIVAEIADAHGLILRLNEKNEKGSEIEVLFPA